MAEDLGKSLLAEVEEVGLDEVSCCRAVTYDLLSPHQNKNSCRLLTTRDRYSKLFSYRMGRRRNTSTSYLWIDCCRR